MTAPIATIGTKNYSYVDLLKDSAPRRKLQAERAAVSQAERDALQAELDVIGKQLAQSNMNDRLSQDIVNWHSRFVNAVGKSKNLNETLTDYIALLQEILVDDVRHVPLDERALYGSDGRTYSFMSYNLYQRSAPAEFRGRSPLNPKDKRPFTTTPHCNAAHMVRWLQRHNAQLHSRELEQEYEQLMQRESKAAASLSSAPLEQAPPLQLGQRVVLPSSAAASPSAAPTLSLPISIPLPQESNPLFEAERKSGPAGRGRAADALPDERRERIRRLAERQAQRLRRDEEERQVLVEQLRQMSARVDQIVEQSFAPIHQEMEAVRRRTAVRMDAIRQMDDQVMEALTAEIGRLRAGVQELEAENQQLERGIQGLDRAISEAEKDDKQLKIDINATRIAIKERKRSFFEEFGSVMKSLAVIGACAFANWAFGGVPMAFFPTTGGFGVAIPL